MKKYKIHFSFYNLFADSQKEVVVIQNRVKGLMGLLTAGTWYADSANHAMMVGFAGMLIDSLIGCLYFEEIQ